MAECPPSTIDFASIFGVATIQPTALPTPCSRSIPNSIAIDYTGRSDPADPREGICQDSSGWSVTDAVTLIGARDAKLIKCKKRPILVDSQGLSGCSPRCSAISVSGKIIRR
jgi:hypothetical protein